MFKTLKVNKTTERIKILIRVTLLTKFVYLYIDYFNIFKSLCDIEYISKI